MAEADDYESLPATTPFKYVALAGAAAGVAEHVALFPVDSVKTRMQSLACEKQHRMGIMQMLRGMMAEEGMLRPIRGASAMMAGAGPAHAMYFGCIEMGKRLTAKFKTPAALGDGFSAIFATCLHDAVMTPSEVVKQRMQMCCSPHTKAFECTKFVYQTEGLRAFYRSYWTALSMNIPYQMTMVVTYGLVQRHFNPEGAYNPAIHFLAGAAAGGVASVVTMPLDVCKTLLNTQESAVLKRLNKPEVRGLRNAARTVFGLRGFRGFFQGLMPRILYQAPSTAISWSVYEGAKYLLRSSDGNDGSDDYETLQTVMKDASASGQIGSRVGHLSPGKDAAEESVRHLVVVGTPKVAAAASQ